MERKHAYEKLYQLLRKKILGGEYQEGDLLPSEHALRSAHKLNRATVRQSLQKLQQEGLIDKQQGKGSIVTYPRAGLDLLSFRGFTEVIAGTPHQASTEWLHPPYESEWPDPFFYPLSPQEKEVGCWRIDRLRKVDEEAVMLEYTYLAHYPGMDNLEAAFEKDSLFATLSLQYQIEIKNVTQHIRAIGASVEMADRLNVKPGVPILSIYRKYGTNRQGFYLYSALYCNTENYSIGGTFQ